MNENINLCELLKGHEGETFYSPVFGNITLSRIKYFNPYYPLEFENNSKFTPTGQYDEKGECVLFPSKDQRDWNKWAEEQKPKVPKTWSEMTHCNVEVWQAISHLDYSVVEPILKSILALFKIHQLIEVGYGGNITNEEWSNKNVYKYCIDILNDEIVLTFSTNKHIAFHKDCQREEFLSYPENVQLVKDFYRI